MRALVLFTLQRKLCINMRRTQLMGYLPQPGSSDIRFLKYKDNLRTLVFTVNFLGGAKMLV